jgi:hypothetical protein
MQLSPFRNNLINPLYDALCNFFPAIQSSQHRNPYRTAHKLSGIFKDDLWEEELILHRQGKKILHSNSRFDLVMSPYDPREGIVSVSLLCAGCSCNITQSCSLSFPLERSRNVD